MGDKAVAQDGQAKKKRHNQQALSQQGGKGITISKGAIPDLPVIDFQNRRVDTHSFNQIKERVKDYVANNFSRNAHFFDADEEYEFPELEDPDEVWDDTNDPFHKLRNTYKKKVEQRAIFESQYEENKPRVYAVIWGQCTPTMRLRLQRSGQFAALNMDKDPLELWREITKICLGNYRTNGNTMVIQYEARKRFDDLFQGSDKIGVFYEKFRANVESAKAVGVQFVGEPIDPNETIEEVEERFLAIHFLKKLDKKRFGSLQNKLENDLTQQIDSYPTTLVDAYEQAASWRDNNSGKFADDLVTVATANAVQQHGVGLHIQGDKNNKKKTGNDKQQNKGTTSSAPAKTRVCYLCQEPGHIQKDCPVLQMAKDLVKDGKASGSTSSATVITFGSTAVCSKMCCTTEEQTLKKVSKPVEVLAASREAYDEMSTPVVFGKNDVLLDNQSNTHIFNNRRLLTDLRRVKNVLVVKGVNGGTLETNVVGTYLNVENVYYHPKAIANILSFHKMARHRDYVVSYDSREDYFILTSKKDNSNRKFSPWRELYVYRNSNESITAVAAIETVDNNKLKFTNQEVERAEKAKELIVAMGRPSTESLVQALKNGIILECPVSAKDVYNMEKIFGKEIGSIKGKTVRKVAPTVETEVKGELRPDIEEITLCADLMYVNGVAFLLTVSRRLQMLMVKYLPDKGAKTLKKAMFDIVGRYKVYHYKVSTILFDGEGAISAITTELNMAGIEVNPAGKGAHVPEVERAIRVVKERVRSYLAVLPYSVTSTILVYLVYFCVSNINQFPRSGSIDQVNGAKQLLTGRKPNYKHSTKILFGEYAQVYDELTPTNSMEPRTTGAIALGLSESRQGMFYFLSLSTWKVLLRRSFTKLPISAEVIQLINAKASTDKASTVPVTFQLGTADPLDFDEEDVDDHAADVVIEDDGAENEDHVDEAPLDEVNLEQTDAGQVEGLNEYGIDDDPPDEELQGDVVQIEGLPREEADVEIDEEESQSSDEDNENVAGEVGQTRYGLRPNRARFSWKTFGSRRKEATTLTNLSIKKAVKAHGPNAVVSLMNELRQMVEKNVFKVLKKSDINKSKKALPIIMFLKVKRDGRLKARGVADGRWQRLVRELFDVSDSSPTISTEALMITLIVDVSEGRIVITIDIDGAYLHALMDEEVYVVFDPVCTGILVDMFPELFESFVEEDGKLYGRLIKALYGCLQSARLFYEHLRKSLESIGFTVNPYDVCVFNAMYEDSSDGIKYPVTVTVHVDDLKVSSKSQAALDWVAAELKRVYKKINVNSGKVIDYLGMVLDFNVPGEVSISSKGLVEESIEQYDIGPGETTKTPAANYLFLVTSNAESLSGERKEKFHSMTQKLLYIAKHSRPDILLAVSFLTTRVSSPTVEDEAKLIRVLKYLNGSKDLVQRISANDVQQTTGIYSYVDASFATHPDARSHTGGIIGVGGNLIMAKSTKQKLNVKSSTEAELVGVSDIVPFIMWVMNFVVAQGYAFGDRAILLQDNMSTMKLINNGKPCSNRTRHLHIRYFFVTDQVKNGKLEVKYVKSEDMLADYLTKPLQGEQFVKLRNQLMNVRGNAGEEFSVKGCVDGGTKI